MKKIALLIGIIVASCFYSGTVYAQFDISQFRNSLAITMTPNYPEPHTVVHLTAHDSLSNIDISSTVWQVGNKIIATGSSVDVVAGDLGSESIIVANLTTDSGPLNQASVMVAPTEMDLLFDAQSYTPPFYKGRSFPSPETDIRLQAIVRLKQKGTLIPNSDILYSWKKNGSIISSASGFGKSSALLPGPSLFSTDTISVTASSRDATRTASALLRIPSIEPLIILYQNHPLFGIMQYQAVPNQFNVAESEMTFSATPYFANVNNSSSVNLSYLWKIGNQTILPNQLHPDQLTINAMNSDGVAALSLELTSNTNFAIDSNQSWKLQFKADDTIQHTSSQGSGSIFQTGIK